MPVRLATRLLLLLLLTPPAFAQGGVEDPALAREMARAVDPEPEVRVDALHRLLADKREGLAAHHATLIDLLDDKSRVLHRQANGATIATSPSETVGRLLEREGNAAVPALSVALVNQRASVRWRVAHLLGKIGSTEAIEALLAAVTQDTDSLVRMTASEALVKLGPSVVPSLLELLDSASPAEREQAVWMLSEIGDDRTVEPLMAVALGGDARLAAKAEDALLKMGPRMVPSILRIIEGEAENAVKLRALRIASRVKDAVAMEAIVYTLLTHPDREIRSAALGALGSHTDVPYIVDALLNVLFDIDRGIASQVPGVMNRLDPKAGLILESYLSNPSQQMQDVAMEGLRAMGTKSMPSFIFAVENESLSHHARVSAAKTLKRLGYRAVPFREKVTAMALSGDWNALAPMARQVKSDLVRLASAEQPELREGALSLLGEIRASDMIPFMIDRLSDPSPAVRLAAERALRNTERIGFPTMTAQLDKRLNRSVRTLAFILEENGYRPRTDLERVRLYAAKETWPQLDTLGESGLTVLLESLNSDELQVAAWAAWTLARYASHTSLERIGLKAFDPALHEVLYELEPQRYQAGFRTLGGAADRTSVAYLLVPLLGEDEVRIEEAAAAIGIAGVPAVEMLEILLRSDVPRLRERALKAAERIGSGAVDMLLKFLFNEEIGPEVLRILDRLDYRPGGNEEEAYYLLAAHEYDRLARLGRAAIEPLRLATLKVRNPNRIEAILALGRIRDPAVAPDLLRLMNDPDTLIREAAITALGLIGEPAHEPLRKQTTEAAQVVFANLAALALDRLGYKPAGEQEEIWLAACRQDWRMLRGRRKDMIRFLRPNLLVQNNTVRAISTAAFATIRDIEAHTEQKAHRAFQEQMARGLNDDQPDVRAIAARYAGRFAEAAAPVVPRLIQLLDDEQEVLNPERNPIDIPLPPTVAGAAAGALAQIGAPAVGELSRIMDSENPVRRRHARIAIAAISDPRLLPYQIRLLADSDIQLRYQTALTLGRSTRTEAIPPLITTALGSPPVLEKAAMHAIRRIGPGGEATLIEELRLSESPERIRFVLQAMWSLRGKAPLEAFSRHTRHPDIYVRKAAYAGLALQQNDEGVRRLIPGLKDPFWTVRESVVQSAVNVGMPAVGALIDEMPRQDPATARYIEIILQRITNESFGSDTEAWKRWWRDADKRTAPPPVSAGA